MLRSGRGEDPVSVHRGHRGEAVRAAAAGGNRVVRLVKDSGMAVVRIGDVEVILSDGPMAFTDPDQFKACGIDPLSLQDRGRQGGLSLLPG